jgi:hypothetical protein
MIEDINSVFVKYAELMTYEPEIPDKKFKWNDKKMVHWQKLEDYVREDWNDEEEDDDFEEDEDE